MEKLRTETDLQKLRVDELQETYRNIDVDDYNRLKDEVRQLKEKPKAKDAHIEDFKKVLLEKQNKISLLEKELTNCNKDLSEREKRFDVAQQAPAIMQSETEKLNSEIQKLKADCDRYKRSYSATSRKLDKEKEDLSKEIESLSKQLEEAKEAGKRTPTDAMVEQAVKKRREKEHKYPDLGYIYIYIYIHSLKDNLKKKDDELTKVKTERKSFEKVVGESLNRVKKEKTKVEEELVKLER